MQTKLILVSAALFTAVGCSNGAPIQPRQEQYSRDQIHMTSEELRRDTYVDAPKVGRDEAGLLIVSVPIRSAIDKTLYIDCYITFLDRNGLPVSKKMGPKTITLQPHTPDQVTFNSTTPLAEDFQVDFRYAK